MGKKMESLRNSNYAIKESIYFEITIEVRAQQNVLNKKRIYQLNSYNENWSVFQRPPPSSIGHLPYFFFISSIFKCPVFKLHRKQCASVPLPN